MPVKVRGYLTYKKIIGEQLITIPENQILTLSGLLAYLANQLGQDFSDSIYDSNRKSLREHVAVIINGRSYHHLPDGLETPLKDSDDISIFPPMAGG